MTQLLTPPRAAAPTAMKGPPPLPTKGAPDLRRDGAPAPEIYFDEGIDGHAESVPASEPEIVASITLHPVANGGPALPPPLPFDEEAWFEAGVESEIEADEEVEDPARTRRRRALRVTLASGAIAMLLLGGLAMVFRTRADDASGRSASVARVEAVAPAAIALAASPSPTSAAATPQRPPPGATTASTAPAGPDVLRAVRTKSPSPAAARPASRRPKAAGVRPKHATSPSSPRHATPNGARAAARPHAHP